MRLIAIIQARMASTRLPGKVLMDIGGKPMLWHVVCRVNAGLGNGGRPATIRVPVIVATPDQEIADYADEIGKKGYPAKGYLWDGDPNDVLGRYARIATEMAADGICRVTADCPLLDPKPISDVLYLFQTLLYDYVANDIAPTWPDGMGVEVFSWAALDYAANEAHNPYEREHVTPFMKKDRRNSKRNIRCPINGITDLKLSIDTQADLDLVRAIDAACPKDYSLAATLEALSRVQAQNIAARA